MTSVNKHYRKYLKDTKQKVPIKKYTFQYMPIDTFIKQENITDKSPLITMINQYDNMTPITKRTNLFFIFQIPYKDRPQISLRNFTFITNLNL